MECYCCLRNVQDLLSDGKTPYERRFGIPFNGPVIPFGAMVEYHHLGIIVRQHHTDRKLLGLRKRHLRYCCNQVWMKNGGRIPWSATAICETFKISLSDEKTSL